jgi:hypothetical protein
MDEIDLNIEGITMTPERYGQILDLVVKNIRDEAYVGDTEAFCQCVLRHGRRLGLSPKEVQEFVQMTWSS